ncbi:MAG: hypothetical protein WCA12_22110, partial [Burkholderiales bacterium]
RKRYACIEGIRQNFNKQSTTVLRPVLRRSRVSSVHDAESTPRPARLLWASLPQTAPRARDTARKKAPAKMAAF